MSRICLSSDSSVAESSNEMRNSTIDSFRGVLILLVIIRHALQFSVEDEGSLFTNIIWAIQMPGFFCLSGYLAYHTNKPKGFSVKALWEKALRYLIPFVSWLVFIDVLLVGEEKNLLQRISYLIYHMDTGLWFLWTLFIISILGLSLETIRQRKFKTISECIVMGTVVVLYMLIFALVGKAGGTFAFLGVKYILFYCIYFLLGYFYHYVNNKRSLLSPKSLSIVSTISLIAYFAIVFNYDLYRSDDNSLSILMRLIAGVCGTIALLFIVSHYDGQLRQGKINRIGIYSLELYVTHIHVCHLLNHHKAATLFSMEGFLTFIVSLFLTMILTALLIKIIKAFPVLDTVFYGNTKQISNP